MGRQKRRWGCRLLCMLMTFVLLTGVLWVPASAGGGDDIYDSGDFAYSIEEYIDEDGKGIQYARIVSVDESVRGSVTIPAAIEGYPVMEISDYAFRGCILIADIRVASDNAYYTSMDGILLSKDGSRLVRCPEGREGVVTIPRTVKVIGDLSFSNCEKITHVSIPWSVAVIESAAFDGCMQLKTVVLQSRNVEIEEMAIGYHEVPYDEVRVMPRGGGGEYQKIEGVQIFCYPDSTAQKYAEENEFGCQFIIPGDLDGDKEPTTADARLALRAAGQLEMFTPQQTAAADVDYDGEVTPADARMILRAAAGLEASLALPPMAELPEPGPDPDPGTDPEPVLPQGIAETVQFYKSAAQKTADVERKQTLTLTHLDLSNAIQIMEPLRTSLENTLSENSGVSTGVPGDYERLQASDVMSASVKEIDGSIEVTLNLKNFTSNGTMTDPVDHAMDIPKEVVETSIDRIKSPFQVSYDSVSYRHTNATICVNINQETGQIESGTWDCEIQFLIENMKVASNDVNCSGIIHNTIILPAE